MRRHHRILQALLFLPLLHVAALAQDSLWKTYVDAGSTALAEEQYPEAERRFKLALKEAESLGPHNSRVVLSHYHLAMVYLKKKQPPDALQHSRQALAIWEKVAWEKDPRTKSLTVALSLKSLAASLLEIREYTDIERLLKQALVIEKKVLRPNHPRIAETLSYLAITTFLEKKPAEAKAYAKEALEMYEKAGEMARYDDVLRAFRWFSIINQLQGDQAKAEEILSKAMEFRKKIREPEYADSETLSALTDIYRAQKKYKEAEQASLRRLRIIEMAYGPNDSHVIPALDNLADLYVAQNDYAKAESVYKDALANLEKAPGDTRDTRLKMLDGLLRVYVRQNAHDAAESVVQQCLAIAAETVGAGHTLYSGYLNSQGTLFMDREKYAAAEPVFKRALEIREKTLPPESPELAVSLNNLAKNHYHQGKYDQAGPLYQRALDITRKRQPQSPEDLAWYTKNHALLLYAQGKTAEGETLFKDALKVFEENKKERDLAYSLYELAELYRRQKKYEEAEAEFKKAIALMEKQSVQNLYEYAAALMKYASLLRQTNRETEAKRLEARAEGVKSQYARKP